MTRLKILAGCALATLAAASVNAMTTVTMTGTTGSSSIAGTNNTFTTTMVYDELAQPTDGGSSTSNGNNYAYQNYYGLQSMTFTSGSYTMTMTPNSKTLSVQQILNSSNSNQNDYFLSFMQNTSSNAYIQAFLSGGYTTMNTTALTDMTAAIPWTSESMLVSNGNNNYSGTVTSYSLGASAVPEPATWGLMILGFGAIGYALRRQRTATVSFG